MSRKANGVNYGKTVPQRDRRIRALAMLEAQLKIGTKTKKRTIDEKIPLTDKDVSRIKKEIANLKAKM